MSLWRSKGWVVVAESSAPFDGEEWARVLASELDTVGIRLRSWSDQGTLEIARYDAGRETGSLSYDGAKGRGARLSTAFLADLAPRDGREELARGVRVLRDDTDAAASKAARLAGLPELLDRYSHGLVHVDVERTLAFWRPARRPVAVPPPGALDVARLRPRTAKVGFVDSMHLFGLARGELLRALVATLGAHAVVPATGGERDRELFVVHQGTWDSFGEVLHNPLRFPPGCAPVHICGWRWAAHLSEKLAPALLVRAHHAWIELTVFDRGKRGDVVRAIPGEPVDLRPLAPFVRVKDADLKVPRRAARRTIARLVGERLGIAMPVIEGEIRGIVVPFARMGIEMRAVASKRGCASGARS